MTRRVAGSAGRWLRVYRIALWLYPPSFRRRYGDRMLEDVSDLMHAERAAARSALRPLGRVAVDLARSVPSEWLNALVGGARELRRDTSPAPRRFGGAFAHDVRAAARSLRRRPGFTLGLVLLLGVGIGAGTAVFSVASAYVVRALPYPEPDRLVSVVGGATVLPEDAGDLFEIPVTWDLDAFTLVGEAGPELVYGAWVSRGYFEAFGMRAAQGRLFGLDESGVGGASVAVISHDLWQRRYGGDPAVIGRTLSLFSSDRPDDAEVFTIVGILPRDSWHFNRYTDFLAPLRSNNPVYLGRLRRGVTNETAARVLEERSRARAGAVPEGFRIEVMPLQTRYTESIRPMLGSAAGAVLLMLLVACGNAAALLLMRAKARDREFAIRRALGAGRGRLARQLLAEGLFLAGGACVAGIMLAAVGLRLFGGLIETHLGPSVPGGLDALRVDAVALAVTLVVTVLAGVAFGLAPLAGTLRPALSGMLGDAGRASSPSRARRRGLNTLVAAGVALCLTLLVAATLSYRSVRHLATLDLGFEHEQVFTANLLLRAASYDDPADRVAFYDRLAAEVERIPGVEASGLSVLAPFRWGFQPRPLDVSADAASAEASMGSAVGLVAGPGWFEAMRIPVTRGRAFDRNDGPGTERVAIVSERLARRAWPDADPIGRRVQPHSEGPPGQPRAGEWHTVIGVVPDIRGSVDDDDIPALYVALAQAGPTTVTITTRMREGVAAPLPALRDAVRRLDPTLALYATDWLSAQIAAAARPSRFLASFLGGFSAFAMAVAVVGLYAVLSFAGSQQRRDLAIRMALGARRSQVLRRFLIEAMIIVGAGLLAGLVGARLLSQLIARQLHGVEPLDPIAYLAAASLLSVVAALAAWVPAHRAATADPMMVLRDD